MFLCFLMLVPFFAQAETIDDRLRGYITKFNLSNLSPLPARNKALFDLGHSIRPTTTKTSSSAPNISES